MISEILQRQIVEVSSLSLHVRTSFIQGADLLNVACQTIEYVIKGAVECALLTSNTVRSSSKL